MSTLLRPDSVSVFFFNDTATTEIYTLSLHDALPISSSISRLNRTLTHQFEAWRQRPLQEHWRILYRSEEHTSELQSHLNLVCRLLLEKKKEHSMILPTRKSCSQRTTLPSLNSSRAVF